jgi:enterochelin esterase-like enzyme
MAMAGNRGEVSASGPVRSFDRRQFLGTIAALVTVGGCSATARQRLGDTATKPRLVGRPLPTVESGVFYSKARHRKVGWTISYPPNLRSHAGLPLILALHPYTGSHAFPMGGIPPARLLTMQPGGHAIPPVAVAAADGGNGYWHRHPGDDPMTMLLSEFLPMCRARGLGRGHRIGVIGTSMGGYGALLLAEEHVKVVAAVAAVSPAIWLTYQDSQLANPTAFTGAADFDSHDVVSLAPRISRTPVWIASGAEDPFHSGVEALASALPPAHLSYPPGGHNDAFFEAHAAPALRFAASHLIDS